MSQNSLDGIQEHSFNYCLLVLAAAAAADVVMCNNTLAHHIVNGEHKKIVETISWAEWRTIILHIWKRQEPTSTTKVHLRAISVLTEYILLLLLLSKYQAIRPECLNLRCFPLKPLDKNQHHHHLQFQWIRDEKISCKLNFAALVKTPYTHFSRHSFVRSVRFVHRSTYNMI